MKKPKMIVFDYGQTLIDEPYFDGEKGTAAVMRYAVKNKYGRTPQQIQEKADEINRELGRYDPARRHLCQIEVPVYPFDAYLYESNGIELSIPYSEAERIFWEAAAPGAATPGIAEFLNFLKKQGIRTGVISNITYSGKALTERINRLLPDNTFEFIIASSEYVFRKPNRRIFELALEKAELEPEEVWYIGDNLECDIVGAKNAGLFPVWYRLRRNEISAEVDGAKEVFQISAWQELREALEEICGKEETGGAEGKRRDNRIPAVPQSIQALIRDREYRIDDVGLSDSSVICFEDMVLKIERAGEEAECEYKTLEWLAGKLPAPKILRFEKQNGFHYLLMSRMDGVMSCSEEYMKNPEELVRLLAQGLKLLWNVDTKGCPGWKGLDHKLRLARQRVEAGLCDMENVQEGTYGENGFENPAALLAWLEENRPQEEPVFSHGDYCLPNLFLKDGAVSGFLDLGRSGIADKYQDIALCYRSLRDNYNGKYGKDRYAGLHFKPESLFEALDMEPDWEQINYYILLDELF